MPERQFEVRVPIERGSIAGGLSLPEPTTGLVIFAHGSGSSRFSPRNQRVASGLRQAGLATLLLDLLTPQEERLDVATGKFRFDVDLLAGRVVAATDWAASQPVLQSVNQGYFGASTGAAAALIAAARRPDSVSAVVSRGGRPDLAGPALAYVRAPTLLIVGSEDTRVLELNEQALAELGASHKELRLVPGATHLFEEPGALEQVVHHARQWFEQFLVAPQHPRALET